MKSKAEGSQTGVSLRQQRRLQASERLAAGEHWEDNDLMFATPLGHPIDPRIDWQTWKDLLEVAKVPEKRLHDARYTAATILLAQGVDSRIVMDVLGWSEQRTAKRYTHVVPELKREAARLMDAALW